PSLFGLFRTAADFAETRSVCELGKIVQAERRRQTCLHYSEPPPILRHCAAMANTSASRK
ncbi:MAG: hypothetical protein IKC67_00635, partial [Odoribacter sp.]|nr:hypothetical protein [Odoribacter sp.]